MKIPKRPRAIIDLTSQQFGDLTVLGYAGSLNSQPFWNCKCKCGGTTTLPSRHLRSGHTKSCGCRLRKQQKTLGESFVTHGATRRGACWREYRIWNAMKRRCHYPKDSAYHKYGGRGIQVCERWRLSFTDFLEDMGGRFPPRLSIDRIDVNGNYEPSNCRLATVTEQARNKRNTFWLTLRGETLCATEWAERLGVKASSIRARRKLGWSDEEILTTPVRRGANQKLRSPSRADLHTS